MPNKTARRKTSKPVRGWKYIQTKKHINQRTKLAIIVFAAVATLLLLSQAVKFTQMLFNPWRETNSVKRASFWNGNFNFNVVILAKGASLLSFNPKEHKVTIVDIPPNLYLEASHGFGKWQISSIYGLGQSQNNLGGGKLLKDTTENLFGLPIDGFLKLSDQYSKKDAIAIVLEIKKNPFSIISVLPSLKTNLTPYELIRLDLGLFKVRFDKIKQINLENAGDFLQKDKLPDGTEILTADTVRLDSLLSGLIDSAILSEHKKIAIFNATSHPGLAQKAARMIANIGGDVIITSNGQNQLKKSKVVGEQSNTLDRLRQIFTYGDIIDSKDKDLFSSRAEIDLFLGEDYFDRL